MIAREWRAARMAMIFLTRIPVPSLRDFRDADLHNAARWFPAVGALVGAVQAAVLVGAAMVLPPLAAAMLALAATLLVTGAFHEDGLADAVDGLGGGYTRERALAIMKDSRIGSYGAAALMLVLGLQAVALAELAALPAAVIAAHAGSRFVALTIMATQNYVRDDETARAKPMATRIGAQGLVFAAACTLAPALFLPGPGLAAGAAAMLAARLYWGRVCTRRLGGYTGDMLGAAQQLAFTAGLLGVVAAL